MVFFQRNDRRLFQYRFTSRGGSGILSATVTARVLELAQSTQLRDMRTAPAVVLRNKNVEGWYVLIGHEVLLLQPSIRLNRQEKWSIFFTSSSLLSRREQS
jgi:hypothetical protein